MSPDFEAQMTAAYERCGFMGERVIGFAYKVRGTVQQYSMAIPAPAAVRQCSTALWVTAHVVMVSVSWRVECVAGAICVSARFLIILAVVATTWGPLMGVWRGFVGALMAACGGMGVWGSVGVAVGVW